jgi:hypothetical protein
MVYTPDWEKHLTMARPKPHWLNAWLKPKPELQRAPENDRLSRMAIEEDGPQYECHCGNATDVADTECFDCEEDAT